jgi:hypothetical protein
MRGPRGQRQDRRSETEHEGHQRAQQELYEHQQRLAGFRQPLVVFAHAEEADHGTSLRDAAERGRHTMVKSVRRVQQLREVVHEELRVRERDRLWDEHEPKVERKKGAEDRHIRGGWLPGLLVAAGARFGVARLRRLDRWRAGRYELVPAKEQEQCLQRQHRILHRAPVEAGCEELTEEDVSDRRAEA